MWLEKIKQNSSAWALTHPKRAAALCGVGVTLGFAPLFAWPVALAALVVALALALHQNHWRQAVWIGFAFGAGMFLTSLYWLPRSFVLDFGSWWLGLLAGIPALLVVVALLAVGVALPFVVAFMLRAQRGFAVAAFAVAWLAVELLRGLIFPWNALGYIWADNLMLMQHASWGTVYGLSVLVLIVAGLGVFGRRGVMISVLLLAGLFGSGEHLYRQAQALPVLADSGVASEDVITVRLVQPNIQQLHKWDVRRRLSNVEQTLRLSLSEEGKPTADVLIWPETAAPFDLNALPPLRAQLTTFLPPEGTLLTGGLKENIQPQRSYYNSVYQLGAEGMLQGRYDKHILVPFGEYIPLRFLLSWFKPLVQTSVDFASGKAGQTLNIPHFGAVLPLVCFEAIFPFYTRQHSQEVRALVNVTNDAWFDGTTAPHQHFAMARMRSVEARKPLLRVANTGITALVAPSGFVSHHLPLRHAGAQDFQFLKMD